MSDMQTMPVRDLIASIRDQIANAPPDQALQLLVLGVLVRRIEEQADLADNLAKLLHQSIWMPDTAKIRQIEAFKKECEEAIDECFNKQGLKDEDAPQWYAPDGGNDGKV